MWLALLLAALGADYTYRQALAGYRYEFPKDHFEHPEFHMEWWYYTGNVRTAQGRRYGFELVFFRQAQRRGPTANLSAWRVDDLYLAHLALTDIAGNRFLYQERLNRAGPGVAGGSLARQRIWNGNWSVQWEGETQTLEAMADEFHFRLRLRPVKQLVIHGENGVSQKAAGAGKASYYLSFPRLEAEGELDGAAVRGTAWMDHEWFSHPLDSTQVGWDWFSAQLDDGTELMLFELRRADGTIDPYSSGSYVDRQGRARHLKAGEFSLERLEYWTSPRTQARYPVRWRVRAPTLGVAVECTAAVRQQELVAKGTGPSYWEGAVNYSGTVTGVGYLEMTGYRKPMRLE
jgi:predicted secreted hydrolase